MSSSELLRCRECGQSFDTVESLREHMKSEKDEIKNRVKRFSDGSTTANIALKQWPYQVVYPYIVSKFISDA